MSEHTSDCKGKVVALKQSTTPYRQPIESGELREIHVELLQRGQYQPRLRFDAEYIAELADSIKKQGVLQPLIVRPVSESSFEIIAGERRWRAAQKAQLESVPCIVRDYDDKQAAQASLSENLQRRDLNPIEEAKAYQRIKLEFGLTQVEMAESLGIQRSKISKLWRLLELPQNVQSLILEGKLKETHGQELHKLEGDFDRSNFAESTYKFGWTVSELRKQITKHQSIKQKAGQKTPPKTIPQKDRHIERLENLCSDQVGLPIRLEPNKNGWQVVVTTCSEDELHGLFLRLGIELE